MTTRRSTSTARPSPPARLEELKGGLIERAASTYERAMLLLLRLQRPAQAFALSERARARLFLDQIGNARIASLWSVDDEATGVLMTSFYRHLREGQGKAQALRSAQAETRRRFAHPYYWAAFVLSGDPGSAAAPGWSWPGVAAGGLVVLAAASLAVLLAQKHRRAAS